MVAAGRSGSAAQNPIEILGLPDLAARIRFPLPYYTVNEGLYL